MDLDTAKAWIWSETPVWWLAKPHAFFYNKSFCVVGVRPGWGLVDGDSLDDGAALRVRPLRRGRQALRFRRLGRRRHRSASLSDPDPGQCCGSMTFWGGSGSTDSCLWPMDPDPNADPDPAIFVIDLQDSNKNKVFMFITFWSYIYIIFQR